MEDYTKEIQQIINNHALPDTSRHLVKGKTEISKGFIKDIDGNFHKIAKAINSKKKKKIK